MMLRIAGRSRTSPGLASGPKGVHQSAGRLHRPGIQRPGAACRSGGVGQSLVELRGQFESVVDGASDPVGNRRDDLVQRGLRAVP
jgi:hypothetical protein